MLNESERQVLAHLEATLRRDDPELAAALLELAPPRGCPCIRVGHDLAIALAVIEASVCLVLHTAGSVTPGLAAAGFALVTAAVRSRRFPRQPRRWLQGYL
jgi:hypothetical protein